MREVIILGAGRQGIAAGEFLLKRGFSVSVSDIDSEKLKRAGESGFKTIKTDLSNYNNVVEVLAGFDAGIAALPAHMGRMVELASIESGKNLVDVTYLSENPLELDKKACEKGIIIIPDAGIAPGVSNLIAGYLYSFLDELKVLRILVGGIPQKNIPPLGYKITWSPEDLIEEYTREARIKKNGEFLSVPALSGIEEVYWGILDNLEAFYTDGLRTLLDTLTDVDTMEEKTIRYRGHAEKMKLLFDMGYFREECDGLSPREVSVCLFSQLKAEGIGDLLLMRVIGKGKKDGNEMEVIFELTEKSDNEHSAMERTTGFGCGMFTYLMLTEDIGRSGVLSPEELGMNETIFRKSLSLLAEEGIIIERFNK